MTEQTMLQINKRELAPGVVVYSNIVPGHEQVIPYTEQVTGTGMVMWEKAELGGNSVDTILLDYPIEFKDPNDQSILFNERLSIVFGSFLGFAESDYIQSAGISKNFLHDKMLLMKYSEGISFPLSGKDYGDHISVMYYLNDDYEGGTIEFPNLGVSYQPKANEALIFPASKGFEYTVAKMTSGTKYSVVTYLR